MTSSLLPIPQPGGPAAADGDTRADRAGQPADAPAEDEVSTASQWADHARFAHAPLGTHPQPGAPQGWQGQIRTRPLGCARQSTHSVTPRCTTHIPPAHRLCSFTLDSLCVPRTQLRTSYTPILLTRLNSELGHGRPGPTRHTPAQSFLWPPKRTRVHTHWVCATVTLHTFLMAHTHPRWPFLLPLGTRGTTHPPRHLNGPSGC